MAKELPNIEIVDNDQLVISISLDDLIFIIENKGDDMKVNKPGELLSAFATELTNHVTTNSQERGLSALQELFDTIADEVFCYHDDIIIQLDPEY